MNQTSKLILTTACTLLCGLSLSASAQTLPDDKGKAEFVHNCTACHGVDLVLAVKKTPEDWKKNVYEMASRGVDGTPQDIDNVVVYLDKYFSTDTPAPPPGAPPAAPPAAHPSMPETPNHAQLVTPADTARLKRFLAESHRLLATP